MKRFFPLFLSLFLTACGSQGMNLGPWKDPSFTREKFAVCHGFNCYYRTQGGITDKQWAQLQKIFKPAPKTAEAERAMISKAIGKMEYYAGLSSGLNQDRGKAETFEENRITQMDCIDETINTDQYLHFLEEDGLFKFHRTHGPVHRGYFIDGAWPHNSGAVEEIKTGTVYVIDSYYKPHAQPAYVVPLKDWSAFWRPPEETRPMSKPVKKPKT